MSAIIPVICTHSKRHPPVKTGYGLPPGSMVYDPTFKCPDGRVRPHYT